jgi:hypothetical protein
VKNSTIVLALAVLVGALAAHSLGIAGDAMPSLSSTYPTPLVLPLFFGVPPVVIALAYSACFALWSKQLFHDRPEIPKRSIVMFVISCALSCFLFAVGWGFGVRYQGIHYVLWTAVLALSGAAVLILLLLWNRRVPTFAKSAAFHSVLFAWLCTYAMPYLGETP